MKNTRQSGFTIVELMISTVIFSMILLILTTGVISFTRSYYKGITETSTQRVARVISDDITQGIQSSSMAYASVTKVGAWSGFCIGDVGYVYQLGLQLSESSPDSNKHQASQVLLKGNAGNGCSGYTSDLLYTKLNNGLSAAPRTTEEMLAPSMRLANLDITIVPKSSIVDTGIYSVLVNVVYGDDDLLTNPTGISPSCNADSGSQFCAISGLSTVVQKRIQQ